MTIKSAQILILQTKFGLWNPFYNSIILNWLWSHVEPFFTILIQKKPEALLQKEQGVSEPSCTLYPTISQQQALLCRETHLIVSLSLSESQKSMYFKMNLHRSKKARYDCLALKIDGVSWMAYPLIGLHKVYLMKSLPAHLKNIIFTAQYMINQHSRIQVLHIIILLLLTTLHFCILLCWITPGSGTSIPNLYCAQITLIIWPGVKPWGPVTLFGLKYGQQTFGLTR